MVDNITYISIYHILYLVKHRINDKMIYFVSSPTKYEMRYVHSFSYFISCYISSIITYSILYLIEYKIKQVIR